MAVPRFSYELSPRRKDRYVVSVILHIAAFLVLWRIVPLLPEPQIAPTQTRVEILYTPAPELQPPAPTPKIVPPSPKILAEIKPKVIAPPPEPKIEPPKIELQPKLNLASVPVPVKPKLEQKVVTGTFTRAETVKPVENKKEVVAAAFSGSSQPATLNKPAREVQTGGFGDPNGIRGTSEKKAPLMVASLGAFNLPAGPGNGNGTGGARGAQGTVASAGFGDVAGGGTGNRQRQGSVSQGGFSQVEVAVPTQRTRAEEKSNIKPVEILFKPRPAYTEEARRLRVEGEVVVEVMFSAAGQLQVHRVVKGLGHGLDESALRAAQQIRFRPAQRNGQPYDSAALVHIVFELAE
ncbi:MAG TPA: energy transducer TonB [Candidatus Angelobacter sp.]|nr:energy transducer TonB [Candidatus Angelobacter sp.]